MTAQFSIGPSSYPDLLGIEQVTATERIALQFLSMKIDFDQMKASEGSGDRLSANEGRRSKDRCYYLWDHRAALGIVVAPPLTSRHYVSANAIDVGVTMSDGRNRALTPAEFDWMHANAERRGFTWTGRNFGEPWHIEGATRVELVPPYPNARALVAAGPALPSGITAPQTDPEETPMQYLQVSTTDKTPGRNGAIFMVGPQFLTHFTDQNLANRMAARDGKKVEPVSLEEAQAVLGAFHVPYNYASADVFRRAAPLGQWDTRGAVK